jgi:hypothetical protein
MSSHAANKLYIAETRHVTSRARARIREIFYFDA